MEKLEKLESYSDSNSNDEQDIQLDYEYQQLDIGAVPNETNLLKQAMESFEFIQKCIITFPTSVLEKGKKPLSLNDKLFIEPQNRGRENLADLAWDNVEDRRKRLNEDQRKQLRKTGQFSVESTMFPEQHYVWETHGILQTGTHNIAKRFKKLIAYSLYHLIIGIPDRIYRHEYISFKRSVINFFKGLYRNLNSVVGMPRLAPKYNDAAIEKFANCYIFDNIMEGYTVDTFSSSTVKFVNEDGQLRFLKFYFMDKDKTRTEELNAFLEKWNDFYKGFTKGWSTNLNQVKANILAEAKDKDSVTQESLQDELDKFQETQFFEQLKQQFKDDDSKLYYRLKGILTCTILIRKLKNLYNHQHMQTRSDHIDSLKRAHSIKSLLGSWIEHKMDKFDKSYPEFETFLSEQLDQYELTDQERAIVTGYLQIKQTVGYHKFKKDMKKIKEPTKTFTWSFPIWNPNHWKIKTRDVGYDDNKRIEYYPIEERVKKTTNKYPLWRFANIFWLTIVIMMNGWYYMFLNIIFGPIGLISQFKIHEFHPHKKVNRDTGAIEADYNQPVQTWCSRLKGLKDDIKNARHKYKMRAHTSIVPESIGNFFNWIYNWVIKGIGFPILFFGQPIMTIMNLVITICVYVTMPAIALVSAIISYLFTMLISDLWAPTYRRRALLYNIIWTMCITGILNFVLNTILIVLHVLASILILVWALFSNALHITYDSIIYLFLRKHFYIPSEEGFFAKKKSGPGTSSSVYYQVELPVAKLLLQMHLESKELDCVVQLIKKTLNANIVEFKTIMNDILNSVGLSIDGNTYLQKRIRRMEKIKKNAETAVKERKDQIGITSYNNTNYVRMGADQLDAFIEEATEIVTNFYEMRLLDNYEGVEKIVEDSQGSWKEVTRKIIAQIFSNQFLTPLEQIDEQGFTLVRNSDSWVKFAVSVFDNNYEEEEIHFRDNTKPVVFDKFVDNWPLSWNYTPYTYSGTIEQMVNPDKEFAKRLVRNMEDEDE